MASEDRVLIALHRPTQLLRPMVPISQRDWDALPKNGFEGAPVFCNPERTAVYPYPAPDWDIGYLEPLDRRLMAPKEAPCAS